MSTLVDVPAFHRDDPSNFPPNAADPASPSLRQIPHLLEYRSEADPDAEFIPKTIAGFISGAMIFGFCINFADTFYNHAAGTQQADLVNMMLTRGAFMLGIISVASSLLLVGLKVRADHSSVNLFSRHWINSLSTGAFYALLIWVPWILIEHGFALHTNRFLASAILMAILAFPAIAAKWIIGPQPALPRP